MKNVLVVEDESIIRQGLKVLLEAISGELRVWEANSGEEGMMRVRQQIPHLIITDIRMGGMDGLAFISKVRQVSEDVPVIILSGHSDFEYARAALKYGVNDYLLKPVNRVELSNVITNIFKDKEEESYTDVSGQFQKILHYVHDHIGQEVTLKHIADHMFLHPQYIGQLFKSELNQTFTDYLTGARLKRAKNLLKNTNLKVYEVAQLSGYKSPKHFMSLFKQEVGLTPKEYRKLS
ncbi:response regulator transcription factor [Cytobacillus firmus]|uniref:response regulator transcription factor n=1 Tax=Cytobacillus firmus TaxID=1399 RepID=UPI002030155C|nr:response regulator [Cytobacillus firmus]URT70571.1 response regulator [Cytobacillus firmus]WHY61486.1 response regulator [Cytobacillus firmus]